MRRASCALVLGLCLAGAGPAWSAPPQGCGVFSIDRLIAQSRRVKVAQTRLIEEFAPRTADLEARHQRIRRLELALYTFPASGPSEDRAALEGELALAQAAYAAEKAVYLADTERRSHEVLSGVLKDASLVYQAVGTQRGLARLYQEGLPEPIFAPAAGATEGSCADKIDMTDEVVQAFDAALEERRK